MDKDIYIAYGTEIESDIKLGEPAGENRQDMPRVRFHRCSRELLTPEFLNSKVIQEVHGRSIIVHTDREVTGFQKSQPLVVDIGNVIRLAWSLGGETIQYQILGEGNEELATFWLLHLFLPVFLFVEGHYRFLHASSVMIDDVAVAFVAPPLGGKSTLAAMFVELGHDLVSDDKLATFIYQGEFHVVPSHGRLRPYRQVEDLGYQATIGAHTSTPLAVIYELRRVAGSAPVRIKPLDGFRRLELLSSHSLFGFDQIRAEIFHYLGQMSSKISVRRIDVPEDLARLREVSDAIVRDYRSLNQSKKIRNRHSAT